MKEKIKIKYFRAPWEHAVDKLLTPFEEFISRQTTGGFILMFFTILALMLANSPAYNLYAEWVHTPLSIQLGPWTLEKTLQHWINEGLMFFFFLIVGLELKREMLIGDLSTIKEAALPLIGALGGMLVPALIYFLSNMNTPAVHGWGIPMATDIAFAVGILVLLGDRIPRGLIVFLVALAIADDLGAVLVIALFYTHDLQIMPLLLSIVLFLGLISLNLSGIRHTLPYFLVGGLLWFAMLQSGVHATLAGVFTALAIPVYPKYDPMHYSSLLKRRLKEFNISYKLKNNIITNDKLRAIAQSIERSTRHVQAPLQQLEHRLHLPVTLLVIPLFALFNAGVEFDVQTLSSLFRDHIIIGISLGLFLGKFIGITGFCLLATRLGIAHLPKKTTHGHLAGVSLIAGIGFTMSIFIAELAFPQDMAMLNLAKTGVLLGSLVSGLTGVIWLRVVTQPR